MRALVRTTARCAVLSTGSAAPGAANVGLAQRRELPRRSSCERSFGPYSIDSCVPRRPDEFIPLAECAVGSTTIRFCSRLAHVSCRITRLPSWGRHPDQLPRSQTLLRARDSRPTSASTRAPFRSLRPDFSEIEWLVRGLPSLPGAIATGQARSGAIDGRHRPAA